MTLRRAMSMQLFKRALSSRQLIRRICSSRARNWSFIVINLEYEANDSALSLANSILDSHPNSCAIVATHAYLDENCQYDQWGLHLQNTVLNNHSNVFMTLNGHYYSNGNANRTVIGNRYELFFNYQT